MAACPLIVKWTGIPPVGGWQLGPKNNIIFCLHKSGLRNWGDSLPVCVILLLLLYARMFPKGKVTPHRLYIGRLHKGIDADDLRTRLSKFGQVEDLVLTIRDTNGIRAGLALRKGLIF